MEYIIFFTMISFMSFSGKEVGTYLHLDTEWNHEFYLVTTSDEKVCEIMLAAAVYIDKYPEVVPVTPGNICHYCLPKTFSNRQSQSKLGSAKARAETST